MVVPSIWSNAGAPLSVSDSSTADIPGLDATSGTTRYVHKAPLRMRQLGRYGTCSANRDPQKRARVRETKRCRRVCGTANGLGHGRGGKVGSTAARGPSPRAAGAERLRCRDPLPRAKTRAMLSLKVAHREQRGFRTVIQDRRPNARMHAGTIRGECQNRRGSAVHAATGLQAPVIKTRVPSAAYSAMCCCSVVASCGRCESMTSRTVAMSTPKYSCTRIFRKPRIWGHGISG